MQLEKVLIGNGAYCCPEQIRVAVAMLFAGTTGILSRISACSGEADPSFKRNCIHDI